jgi:hypothetical protein
MEGINQEKSEPHTTNSNGWGGLSIGDSGNLTGVHGYSMEDTNSPNPWPPTGPVQRSTSGSSLASASSQNMNDMYAAEDGNMTVNKVGTTTGKFPLLPRVNIPEKIVICLDLSTDANYTPYRFGDGTKISPLAMMKRVAHIFLYSKKLLNIKHQYALVVLHENHATWLHDFTNDPKDITSILANLTESEQPDMFDLSVLFDSMVEHILLPHVDDPSKIAPSYDVRVILLYARSNCIPTFSCEKASYELLKSSPYFFLDLLYIHEPVTDENKETCEQIFHSLCTQICSETSYVFNVARNPTKLHDCMSKLLAHSLQRPVQEEADYKLYGEGM